MDAKTFSSLSKLTDGNKKMPILYCYFKLIQTHSRVTINLKKLSESIISIHHHTGWAAKLQAASMARTYIQATAIAQLPAVSF